MRAMSLIFFVSCFWLFLKLKTMSTKLRIQCPKPAQLASIPHFANQTPVSAQTPLAPSTEPRRHAQHVHF